MFQCSYTITNSKVTNRGSAIRPTQRSVVVRVQSKCLDGGWSEDSLRRATKIRAFSRNAVMDRKEFKTEINVNWCVSAIILSGEQNNCSRRLKVFCFSSPEAFTPAITVQYSSWSLLLSISYLMCQTLCHPWKLDLKK